MASPGENAILSPGPRQFEMKDCRFQNEDFRLQIVDSDIHNPTKI